MKDEDAIVRGAALSRKNLLELIVVAILLAFGINLLAGQFLSWLQEKPLLAFLIGILLCLFAIAYTLFSLFGRSTKQMSIEAFFAYNPIKKVPVRVTRYEFSENICEYIKAAF